MFFAGIAFAFSFFLISAVLYYAGLRQRNVHIWLRSYLSQVFKKTSHEEGVLKHVMFCFVDHFEPLLGKVDEETGHQRVATWLEEYPKIADGFADTDGFPPLHSFFFPEEEYRYEYLDMLAKLCKKGYGEIEIHLHHDNDTPEGFKKKVEGFLHILSEKHGVLTHIDGNPRFAFIHGNWALDNSRKDGRWCGINNEITLLKELGCYADFTSPSAPSDTQTRTINDIYYAKDDPIRPKSHDTGVSLRVGGKRTGDLMIIQGPLTLNWKRRRLGIWPRVENGDVTPTTIPLNERVDLWVKQGIHVKGRPDWVFVKVHTHGCNETNSNFLFEQKGLEKISRHLDEKYNDGEDYSLHYVTARETFNIIKAAEAGKQGSPNEYRNYILPRPI